MITASANQYFQLTNWIWSREPYTKNTPVVRETSHPRSDAWVTLPLSDCSHYFRFNKTRGMLKEPNRHLYHRKHRHG